MNSETKQALKETAQYALPIILIIVMVATLCVSILAPANAFANC